MSTTVWLLLAMCVVAWVIHRAPVLSQCTSKHCHDGDRDVSVLTSLVDQLQDTVERQQDSAEQQQKDMTALKQTTEQQQRQIQEQQTQLATVTEQQQKEMTTLKETTEQQQRQIQEQQTQLATLKETTVQQQQQNNEQHTQLTSLTEQLRKEMTALKETTEQQQRQIQEQQTQLATLKETVEQKQQQNNEQHTQLASLTEQQRKEIRALKETTEQQQRQIQEQQTQLATLKEAVEQKQQQNREQHTQLASLTEQQRKEMTTQKVTVEQQQGQLTRFEDTLAKQKEKLRDVAEISARGALDCADLLNIGMSTCGVYNINVAGKTVPVWCDMTGGKGWLVFQRRVDNTTDFYRDWKSYKNGFGDPTRNFWLGNDNLHTITAQKTYTLRVDLADFEGKSRYAEFKDFAVANEGNKYRLTVGSYSGTAGDALDVHDGEAFTTRDRDNDKWSSGSCAHLYKGAWWYRKCHDSHLNGLYLGGANTAPGKGIGWYKWHDEKYSLKTVAMKIRPQ